MARFAIKISKREKYVRLLIKAAIYSVGLASFRGRIYPSKAAVMLPEEAYQRTIPIQCATYQYRAKNPDAIYIPLLHAGRPDRTTSAQVQH